MALESAADATKLAALGKQLAMHVAAASPRALSVETLDPDLLARERSVLSDQAGSSGKPEDIVEKMVEGRIRKFYQEVVLLEQVYVVDGETKVAKVVEDVAKELGEEIRLSGFVRFALGEGVGRD